MVHGNVDAPSGANEPECSSFEAYLRANHTGTVIAQDVLLQMGRGALKTYLSIGHDERTHSTQLRRIWRDLLVTVENPLVLDYHLTAACNALCVFMESACSLSDPDLKNLVLSEKNWNECLQAVLASFTEGKTKPIRQVLNTLISILTRHGDSALSRSIRSGVLRDMISVVFLGEHDRVKAALVILEFFVRKIVHFSDIVVSTQEFLDENQVHWFRRLRFLDLERVVLLLLPPSERGTLDVRARCSRSEVRPSLSFVVALFTTMLSRDSQSAAFSLFKAYSLLLISSGKGYILYSSTFGESSLAADLQSILPDQCRDMSNWIHIVQAFLSAHPVTVGHFANLVFPVVFRSDPKGYAEFTALYQNGSISLVASLAAIQTACQIGLEKYSSKALANLGQWENVQHDGCRGTISNLIAHGEAEVRTRTFGLLVSSLSITLPFPIEVLNCLRRNLKFLFGENDAEYRGQVMSLVRKLILRLRGSASTLSKSAPNTTEEPNEASDDSPARKLRHQHDFVSFLIGFLEEELGVTVSYQRHIMALRTVELLVSSGLDSSLPIEAHIKQIHDQIEWPFHMSLHHPSLVQALTNLVLDPYEDVRAASYGLLKIILMTACDISSRPFAISQQFGTGEARCCDNNFDDFFVYGTIRKLNRKKAISTSVASETSRATPQKPIQRIDHMQSIVRVAESLASRTNRADHADGVARLYNICFAMEPDELAPATPANVSMPSPVNDVLTSIEVAINDVQGELNMPIPLISLHARLLSLRYYLNDVQLYASSLQDFNFSAEIPNFILRIIAACNGVWLKVRGRLCVDSPENSTDEVQANFQGGPKDMLSYSWRALRDSSLVLRAILESPALQDWLQSPQLSKPIYERMGVICMNQLSNLRHRGAFSTVAQTFSILCERVSCTSASGVLELRSVWYRDATRVLHEQASKVTRRSAGLPAMISGLLTSCTLEFFDMFIQEFEGRSRYTEDIMRELPQKCDPEFELPQVHALNCLREVFTNAKFRNMSEPYVMKFLRLAAVSLGCNIWAIRNCGLMLFRACTARLGKANTCLLMEKGEDQSQARESTIPASRTSDIFNLVEFLLNRVDLSVETEPVVLRDLETKDLPNARRDFSGPSIATESVFAGLDLISRLEVDPSHLGFAKALVLPLTGSRFWQVREQAARIYASWIPTWDAVATIGSLLSHVTDDSSQNEIHGRLMCVRHILQRLGKPSEATLTENLATLSDILAGLFPSLTYRKWPPIIRSAFLDILNDMAQIDISIKTQDEYDFRPTLMLRGDLAVNSGILPFEKLESQITISGALQLIYNSFVTEATREASPQRLTPSVKPHEVLAALDTGSVVIILRRLSSLTVWNPIIHHELEQLFTSAIIGDFGEDVRSEAMLGLVKEIEGKSQAPEDSFPKAEALEEFLHGHTPIDREAWNVQIRLQASLFTISAPKVFAHCSASGLDCKLCLWICRLREAADDEIDTPTRLNAITSLLQFVKRLVLSFNPYNLSPRHWIPFCLILHDLLNDDDEEIRDLAARAASILPLSRENMNEHGMIRCPSAACEHLSSVLFQSCRHEHSLLIATLNRVMFPPSLRVRGHDINSLVRGPSIRELLAEAQKDEGALFAEEKQNLYVDDARELELWSLLLRKLDSPYQDSLDLLQGWATRVIRYLLQQITVRNDICGPLSFTWRADIFILILRAITLAGVILHWYSRASEDTSYDSVSELTDLSSKCTTSAKKEEILKDLQVLGDEASRRDIHPGLISKIFVITNTYSPITSA